MSEIAKAIDTVIGLGFAEALKRDGYRKRGRTWLYLGEGFTRVVNVQGSSSNIGSTGNFTINLGVYFPEVERIAGRDLWGNSLNVWVCTIRCRLGEHMPPAHDKWWEINDRSDLQAIANDIVNAWEKYGKPWIIRFSDLKEVKNKAAKGDYRLATEISIAIGELEEAQHWLDKLLREYPNRDHALFIDWAARYGLRPSQGR